MFHEKKAFFVTNLWYLKVEPKHSLVRCLYHLSTSCSVQQQKQIWAGMIVLSWSCNIVNYLRMENSWTIIFEHQGSWLLMKSWFMRIKQVVLYFMRKKLGHSRFMKIPFNTLGTGLPPFWGVLPRKWFRCTLKMLPPALCQIKLTTLVSQWIWPII